MSHLILGVKLDETSYAQATHQVITWAKSCENRAVFAANTHLVMEAYDSRQFRQVVNSADLVTSDGMPLVWWLRAKGVKDQNRVYGPDLMLHICQAAASEGIPIGLYGSTPQVITALGERLKQLYPGLQINFSYSPPFRPMTMEEDNSLVHQIHDAGIRILFVGLGCPKQELWIAEHKGKLKSVLVAVGAAFQFHARLVNQAPAWMQKLSLEWLYRLIQEPERLWRRYLSVVPRFSFLVLLEMLGMIHVKSITISNQS